jgi:hypothetical protein
VGKCNNGYILKRKVVRKVKMDMMIFQDGSIAVNGTVIDYMIPIPSGEELDLANADVYKEEYEAGYVAVVISAE